ncbi:FAD-dependent monooxygenase [Spelaeicoccus albus]|uniref:2-polyprenyl-6-methoxyphenol hydroxylase-like FAD-dependent oxidoreductase n=1 Tax=Spelaeicoccus albus TaxID=1280376 RepID=A0A7Z0D3Z6_9MICO|nr:FAD-dependent monooxygenase [Spelaeicoccus albus]NYI68457.1 2-polyprenyl-6-methoxyphenol hydroxylase-like FAD-dependent oxidoreductase [Spelaeicoccus albus]
MTAQGSAAVIGAGISGLASAAALIRAGWRVDVFEKSERLPDAGAGISLMPNAVRALDFLGIGDAVRDLAETDGMAGIRTMHGYWLTRMHAADFTDRFGPLAILPRADLLQLLVDTVPDGTVRYGVRIDSVDPEGSVRTDAGAADYDLVVGADGLRSVVRAACWPNAARPRYTGYTAWRFATDELDEPPRHGAEVWTRGERFGYAPMPGGRAYCFAVQNAPVGGTDATLPDYGYWPAPVPELVRAASSNGVLRDDVYYLPPLRSFVHGRVALVGDAAHAMPPDLGQGAAQGLEDAVRLGASSHDLALYDAERRPRAQDVARRSRRIGAMAQWVSPRGIWLRNTAIRIRSVNGLIRVLAPVLDWQPRK